MKSFSKYIYHLIRWKIYKIRSTILSISEFFITWFKKYADQTRHINKGFNSFTDTWDILCLYFKGILACAVLAYRQVKVEYKRRQDYMFLFVQQIHEEPATSHRYEILKWYEKSLFVIQDYKIYKKLNALRILNIAIYKKLEDRVSPISNGGFIHEQNS
jgi:hypothetical protein